VLDNGASPCLSTPYCRLPLSLATPVEHCVHSKFPSGSAIRVLRFWSRNTATPISPGFASAFFSHPPTTPSASILLLLITCNLLSYKALLSLRLITAVCEKVGTTRFGNKPKPNLRVWLIIGSSLDNWANSHHKKGLMLVKWNILTTFREF